MLKWTRCSWQIVILILISLCCLAPSARAQVLGIITGIVTDPTGAVIPNAKVTVTNEGTSVAASRITNTDGIYTVPELTPGFYTVRAEAQGFKTFVNAHIELTVGYTQRVNFKLEVGTMTQSVTVEGQAVEVDTESNRMSELVTAQQVENLPLNGRNIFQMIQLAPGAVNTTGVDLESGNRGFTVVVNGARENMNGFQIDGIVDKGLSGGSDTQPAVDSVQEFRVDTEVLSAEYGSTVGALTQVSTKSGTNQFHGDAYEFVRNNSLDARNFFETNKFDQSGNEIPDTARNPFRMNQFGATLGGPIKKDKLFFFASYEGERTRIFIPELETMDTPAFTSLIETNAPNSVAALLYQNFPGPAPTSSVLTLSQYLTTVSPGPCAGLAAINASCIGAGTATAPGYGLDPTSGLGAALLSSANMPAFGNVDAAAQVETLNQFYDGNQFSGRIDYSGNKDKIFGSYFLDRYSDPHYSPVSNGGAVQALVGIRGFSSPSNNSNPHLALNWTHTISPTMVNEMRAGWVRDIDDVSSNDSGVPDINFATTQVDFGNYNGYPQIFHEEEFQYADLVTMSHGKHVLKFGGTGQRNYENSEFNVGRPSYDFYDSVFFAMGQPDSEVAGVSPGTVDLTTGISEGAAHLESNIRAWRNWEFGAFINDTYKMTPRLTLTLGLRYDLYTRHTEKYGQGTLFVLPSGGNLTERMEGINCFEDIAGATGDDGQPCDGGFEATKGAIASGDHHDLGPRFGFAYDVFGDGKTSLRGGFGVSYNGEVYNPLSNSRWQPPFYSFNIAGCSTGVNNPAPGNADTCIFGPSNGAAPTYTGPPSNVGAGPAGATGKAFQGNIAGWNPYNANLAFVTGIALQNDFSDPYVYGSQVSLEHQFAGNFVLKTSWVGTFGHKLIRAEDINRYFNSINLSGCGATGSANCIFGHLRTWEDAVNSNYNALQLVLDKKMSRNLELHSNYEWSHSLDSRSSWHDAATTSNGAAEGYSEDQALPGLDYGPSIFDVRNRFSLSATYTLPWMASQKGFAGHLLGGWQANTILQIHGGFPFTPYCSSAPIAVDCDFNLDGVSNDRPNAPASGNHATNTSNAAFESDHPNLNLNPDSFLCNPSDPIAGCSPSTFNINTGAPTGVAPFDGNLGRNTFRGPHFREVDLSFFKNIKATERVSFQFRAEGFNIFNHTNLYQPLNSFFGNPDFGLSTNVYFPRQIQFALKMLF